MKPKCIECKALLKHKGTNKWMCDQNSSVCSQSLKIVYITVPEEE